MKSKKPYIFYSKYYLDYSFGEGHPFWPKRAEKFLELLDKEGFEFNLVEAEKAKDEDILLAHTSSYLERLKEMAVSGGFLTIDTSVSKENLNASYYYVGGTLRASDLALEGKLTVNLLGGLHHAESDTSSGFCIFNDHSIAIRKLQKEGKIKTAAVLDIDVHAGQGTQDIFYSDDSVLKVSIHQNPMTLYPGIGFEWQKGEGKGKGYNLNLVLERGAGENEFLEKLDIGVEKIKKFNPDILFVVFGADTYYKDPLAEVNLELESYGKIAERLKEFDKKVILFAGGYSKDVPKIWFEFLNGL